MSVISNTTQQNNSCYNSTTPSWVMPVEEKLPTQSDMRDIGVLLVSDQFFKRLQNLFSYPGGIGIVNLRSLPHHCADDKEAYLEAFREMAILPGNYDDNSTDDAKIFGNLFAVFKCNINFERLIKNEKIQLFTSEQLMFYLFKNIANVLLKLENNYIVEEKENEEMVYRFVHKDLISEEFKIANKVENEPRSILAKTFALACSLYKNNFSTNEKINVSPRIFSIVAYLAYDLRAELENIDCSDMINILTSKVINFGNNHNITICMENKSTELDCGYLVSPVCAEIKDALAVDNGNSRKAKIMDILGKHLEKFSICAAISCEYCDQNLLNAVSRVYMTENLNTNVRVIGACKRIMT